ncbi:MAG: hypothetical protein ACXWW0_00890 [Bacteroidia bacterium]
MRRFTGFFILQTRRRPIVLIAVVFILSRIIYYATGIRYDVDLFNWAPQVIDQQLLINNLWQSVWYMHGQPPFYNLYNGIVLQLFPANYVVVFNTVALLMSLIHSILLYQTMFLLGVRKSMSLLLTIFFMLSPAAVLYESWHYYSLWEIFFLTASVFMLSKFLHGKKPFYLHVFFVCLACLVLSRSMFHIGWYAIIVAGLIWLLKKHREVILKCAFIPLLLIFLWYGKNYYLYDKFTSSTWLGMSLARIVEPQQGIGKAPTLDKLTVYRPYIKKDSRYNHVPLLHNEEKLNGKHNFNNILYLQVSDSFTKACLQEIKVNPLKYISNVGRAFVNYFEPTANYYWLLGNREKIGYYAACYDLLVINIVYNRLTGKNLYHPSILPMLLYLLIFIASILYIVHLRRQNTIHNNDKIIVIGFILFCILYISAVSNLIEYGENNRFRFTTIPGMIILFGFVTDFIVNRFINRKTKLNK